MPTLPEAPERAPTRAELMGSAVRRASAAIGADSRVTLRLMVFMVVCALGSSMAPPPWAQLALVALLGIAIDIARMRRT